MANAEANADGKAEGRSEGKAEGNGAKKVPRRVSGASAAALPSVPEDPEIAALIFDDRQRKFIVADYSGRIGVFNCLNGAVMKSVRPFRSGVSGLHYVAHDKCIVASSWDHTLLVLWEDDDDDSDFNMPVLRSITEAHSVDITAMCVTYPTPCYIQCSYFACDTVYYR